MSLIRIDRCREYRISFDNLEAQTRFLDAILSMPNGSGITIHQGEKGWPDLVRRMLEHGLRHDNNDWSECRCGAAALIAEAEARIKEAGGEDKMIKPFVEDNFTDDGQHSHWSLIDSETGELLWTENAEEEMYKNGRSVKRSHNNGYTKCSVCGDDKKKTHTVCSDCLDDSGMF